MQTRKALTLEKVERFMEERKLTSIINMHKQSHEKEMDQLQNDFKIKIKKLQKQLIAKKSSMKETPFLQDETYGMVDPLVAKTAKRSKQTIKTIIANVQKHSEYDDRIEKIMKKLESRYDVNEEIHIDDKQVVTERRQKMMENILAEMIKNIQEREKLIYESNQTRGMTSEEIVKEKDILFEQRLNAKMLQYMIENQLFYFQSEQKAPTETEIQGVQKLSSNQNLFNLLTEPEKELFENLKTQTEKRNHVKQNIKFHLNRIGIVPKRIQGTSITIEEMKNLQLPKLNIERLRLPTIEEKKIYPKSTNRYSQDEILKQSITASQSKVIPGMLTERENEFKNIEDLLEECNAAHTSLQKLGRNIVSKKRTQVKKFNSMNLQLNQVKHSSFLDSKLMIVD